MRVTEMEWLRKLEESYSNEMNELHEWKKIIGKTTKIIQANKRKLIGSMNEMDWTYIEIINSNNE